MNGGLKMTRKLFQGTLLILLVNLVVACVFIAPAYGEVINGKILDQDLNAGGSGYTVMKVWGTYYEMGYAHGYLLADDIDATIGSFRNAMGANFDTLQPQIVATAIPADMKDEVNGIVAGVKAKIPSSSIDFGDVMMLNTYADWAYAPNCRSHSCWGSYVTPPVKTLSTRRTDYNGSTVSSLFDSLNIISIAYEPSEVGKMKWVSLGTPGLVIAGTAVNEYGVLVSLHDSPDHGGIHATGPNVITRSIASRYMITDVSLQVDDINDAMQDYDVWTGGFINYYAPEGNAGVFSLSAEDGFFYLRKPQPDYYGGDVIVTSNQYTDGRSTPDDFKVELGDYYDNPSPKTLASHWGLLNKVTTSLGAQQMSVAYRGHEDMTIWIRGRLFGTDTTPTLELEWSELFATSTPSTITQLAYDDFEYGWGNYTDGGSDCSLYAGGMYAHQGSRAANIQDNSGLSSSFYLTEGIDVHTAGYTQIQIDFWFYPSSMESGENFWVQYYDGSNWYTVANYVRGTDFNNGQFYHESVTVNEGTYTFPTNMKIRFQCDASGNYDDVYIDEVKISGIAPGETDSDEDGYDVPVDCDDNNPEINPGAVEVCDGLDNNCDGAIDEDFDHDQDGFTICNGDCEDYDSSINPGAVEVCNDGKDNDCDGVTDPVAPEKCDGIDNDCNGDIDEEGAEGCSIYYKDVDDDAYGVEGDSRCLCVPEGDYTASRDGDCDDLNSTINPGTIEVCDGKDNNCNGQVDEGVENTYYRDADGDSHGDANSTTDACSAPAGYVSNNTDCDDTDPGINPAATEICDDGIDNDCDGDADSDDSDCVSNPKSGCGATPMYGDGGQPHVSAKTSSANALLPLLPSMLALGLWGVRRAGGRLKNR
jgi:hypothetical protein